MGIRILLIISVILGGVALFIEVEKNLITDTYDSNMQYSNLSNNEASLSLMSKYSRERFPKCLIDPDKNLYFFDGTVLYHCDVWEKDLGIEVNVVFVNDITAPLAEFANQLFEARKIGNNHPTGGMLIVIDRAKEKVHMELSYSLEHIIPDAMAGMIVKNQLIPYASYNAVGMALMDTLALLKEYLYVQSLSGKLILDTKYTESKSYKKSTHFLSGGAGAFADIENIDFDSDFKKPVPEKELYRYLPSDNVLESVEAYSNSLRDLIGYPYLSLFTENTQVMKSYSPIAPFELLARHRKILDSKPLKVQQKGDRAVVLSENPVHGFIPILLHRVDNLWRIDLSETWKNLAFDSNGNYVLVNNNTPYAFGLSDYGKGTFFMMSELPMQAGKLAETLETLIAKGDAHADFMLGEYFSRNAFVYVEALHYYKSAIEKAPNNYMYKYIYARRLGGMQFDDHALELLITLNKHDAFNMQRNLIHAYGRKNRFHESLEMAQTNLKRDPYDLFSLRWLAWDAKKIGDKKLSNDTRKKIVELENDPDNKGGTVWLIFTPSDPAFSYEDIQKQGNKSIVNSSQFETMIKNFSNRTVIIDSVDVTRVYEDGSFDSLGDIKANFIEGFNSSTMIEVAPQEEIKFDKVWRVISDKPYDSLGYVYKLCWHGVGDSNKQCKYQRLHITNQPGY